MRSEVQEILQDDEELTWEKLEKLRYTENVIKESLRLHSPAFVSNRVPISDVDVGGYLIPAGTQILFAIDAMQRSSQLWSNPETFDPRRFEENGR